MIYLFIGFLVVLVSVYTRKCFTLMQSRVGYLTKENNIFFSALMELNTLGHEVNDKNGHSPKCRGCIVQKALTKMHARQEEHNKERVIPIVHGQQ